jgi:hypothetical protein
VTKRFHPPSTHVQFAERTDDRHTFPRMGIPRRVSIEGREGIAATVVITTYRGRVWMSIVPAFTWEAIMEEGTVDELMHTLRLARDEAKQQIVAVAEIRPAPARKAIGSPHSDRQR